MSIIRGIGKGLMEAVEDIRPRALVEGGIEQIQAMYVEDRENDQVKLANTLATSEVLLSAAAKEIAKINQRTKLYNRVAQNHGDDVANYLANNKVFAMYDNTNAAEASIYKDIENQALDAKRQLAFMSDEDIAAISNPYLADTKTALYAQKDNILASLNSLENIPDKTGAVALRIADVDRAFAPLVDAQTTGVGLKTTPFSTGMTNVARQQNVYADYTTATKLGIDPTDAAQMSQYGFNPISQNDLIRLSGSYDNLQLIPTLQMVFQDEFTNEINSALYDESKSTADVITKYVGMFNDLVSNPNTTNQISQQQRVINQFRKDNPDIDSDEQALMMLRKLYPDNEVLK